MLESQAIWRKNKIKHEILFCIISCGVIKRITEEEGGLKFALVGTERLLKRWMTFFAGI